MNFARKIWKLLYCIYKNIIYIFIVHSEVFGPNCRSTTNNTKVEPFCNWCIFPLSRSIAISNMLSLIALKYVLIVGILIMGLVSVYAARRLAGAQALFSFGNMLASGVLLSAGLVHQLADSADVLNTKGEFPWAMFIAGSTFILFMVTEELLHVLIPADNDHTAHESTAHEHQHLLPEGIKTADYSRSSAYSVCSHESSCHGTDADWGAEGSRRRSRPSQFGAWMQSSRTAEDDDDKTIIAEHHHHDDHIHLHLHGSVVASVILMMTLSLHSFLAGVSIGIATSVEEMTGITIAILAHKGFEGFCLGINMVDSHLDRGPFAVLGWTFASMTPLGILAGSLISGVATNESTIATLEAVIAGCFLYISIVEIGGKELLACRHDHEATTTQQKVLEGMKLLCFVLGFLFMSYLANFI